MGEYTVIPQEAWEMKKRMTTKYSYRSRTQIGTLIIATMYRLFTLI